MSQNLTTAACRSCRTVRCAIVFTFLAGLAWSPVAGAALRISEFQLATAKLLRLVELRLAEEPLCYLGTLQRPDAAGEFVLDHARFPGPTTLQREGDDLTIVVPLELFTKTPECLRNPDCSWTEYQPAHRLVLQLVFALSADGSNICISFSELRYDGRALPLAALPGLSDALGEVNQSVCQPVRLDALEDLLASDRSGDGTTIPLTIKRSGVSADPNLSRVAVRIEFDDPADPEAPPAASWKEFLAGALSPSVSGMDWSLFVNAAWFTQVWEDRISHEMDDTAPLHVTSGPTARWLAEANGARIDLDVEGAVDGEVCSVDVDAGMQLDFRVFSSKPNVIRVDGRLDVNVDEADIVECALLFGPAGGFFLASTLNVLAVVNLDALVLDLAGVTSEANRTGDDSFRAELPVAIPPLNLSRWSHIGAGLAHADLVLDQIVGHRSGPIMGGPCNTPPAPLPAGPLNVQATDFQRDIIGRCGTWRRGCTSSLSISPANCTAPEIIDDPLHVFVLDGPTVLFDYGEVSDAYFAQGPYPCHVLVRTEGGAATIEIPAPPGRPRPGSATDDGLRADLLRLIGSCELLVDMRPRALEVLWLPNPPPWEVPVRFTPIDDGQLTESLRGELVSLRPRQDQVIPAAVDDAGQLRSDSVLVAFDAEVSFSARSFGAAESFRAKSGLAPRAIEPFRITVSVLIPMNLTGRADGDGFDVDGAVAHDIAPVVAVPADQLPAGFRDGSVQLPLGPSRLALGGSVEPVAGPNATPVANPTNCGDGMCGVGMAGLVPVAITAWLPHRLARRRRRARRCC